VDSVDKERAQLVAIIIEKHKQKEIDLKKDQDLKKKRK